MADNNNAHQAKCNIGRMIEAEALQLGMDAFFSRHTRRWENPKAHSDVRSFAKDATYNLPDYCSFDAFFAKFAARFTAWYETGNWDGIADDPAEE